MIGSNSNQYSDSVLLKTFNLFFSQSSFMGRYFNVRKINLDCHTLILSAPNAVAMHIYLFPNCSESFLHP